MGFLEKDLMETDSIKKELMQMDLIEIKNSFEKKKLDKL